MIRQFIFCVVVAIGAPVFAAPQPNLSIDTVNASDKTPAVSAKSRGPAVLRAQILLDRAHYGVGEIDGGFGSNMRAAITGFQRKRGLEQTGAIGKQTWAALNEDQAPALINYTIQDADVAGPFEPIPTDMMEKANLQALSFATPLEGLAEKFHASPALLKRLNPGKDFTRAGEQIVVPNVLDTEPLPKAGRVVVSKAQHTLTLFDTTGQEIAQFPASTGSEHDPLPIGTWAIKLISERPVFFYNPQLFWDATPGHQKARIAAGPNNPVGLAWLELTKPHYGIHGTPEPSGIGKTQSHGCIRVTNWDVTALLKSVPTGTEVVLEE
ncbi:murein L,D-transpeptidase [Massilia arenosa]|uniref:Murein L,D-transpeptidase n=1 Tax=Zemynaea arenosa TaxID=2561931 RepID=A0A4Y9RV70_9BURK|nr:murein L,D-transpeptidase [Massilia arenosa]